MGWATRAFSHSKGLFVIVTAQSPMMNAPWPHLLLAGGQCPVGASRAKRLTGLTRAILFPITTQSHQEIIDPAVQP